MMKTGSKRAMCTPAEHEHLAADDPGLLRAVAAGEARLTPDQGLALLRQASLATLGRYADARCRTLHGPSLRTYVIDRNINYTNVCSAKCTFCAFRRDGDDHDAYTLDHAAILDKVGELVAIGGTQILMQGGMNPALPLSWYTDLLRLIKAKFPSVHIHAFSPPEFIEFVGFFDPPGANLEEKVRWVMVRLRDAGLDSVPGGGGEIFSAPVRRKIGLGKCDAEAWLTVMYVAHTLGMFTSATMMFGHIEGLADRVHHLWLVRQWQDRVLGHESETPMGHYKAFISWPFQRENTPLGRVKDWGSQQGDMQDGAVFPGELAADLWWPTHRRDACATETSGCGTGVSRVHDWARDPAAAVDHEELACRVPDFGRRVRLSSASDYLRTQAVSRLFLDNVYSIGASWVTMGPHVGQVGLRFGANDMGSVMMEENVVSSAGTTYCMDEAVLCRLIRDAGFVPAQRNNTYDIVRVHDGAGAPDLRVTDWSEHRTRKMHQEAPRPVGTKRIAKATLTVGGVENEESAGQRAESGSL